MIKMKIRFHLNFFAWNKVLFLGILFISCSTDNNYKYEEGVLLYLFQLGIDIEENKIVLFIPVGECYTCVDPALSYLKNHMPNVDLVLISNPSEIEISFRDEVFLDNSTSFKKYQTGIFSPCIFTLNDQRVLDYLEIKSSDSYGFGEIIEKYVETY